MTTTGFAGALKVVLTYEGGRAHHAADPGGRTNQGVTQRVYDGYRDRQKKDRRSVDDANAIEISEIYRLQYWQKIRGDALPAGIDVVVFDGAVHSGPVQSAKWLQRALGTVPVDGMIGELTLSAVEVHPDHDQLIAGILERRLAFLAALRTWSIFGRGWSSRVEHLQMVGQALASGSVPPAPEYFAGGEAKATIADARGPVSTTLAAGASGGGGCASLLPWRSPASSSCSEGPPMPGGSGGRTRGSARPSTCGRRRCRHDRASCQLARRRRASAADPARPHRLADRRPRL